jgi:hypothetical protein
VVEGIEDLDNLDELIAPLLVAPEGHENLNVAMAGLECTFEACTSGEGGARFRTNPGDLASTLRHLQLHREDVHGQAPVASGGANKVQLSKIPRPEIRGGCSQEDFKFFTRKWDQYVRSSNEQDPDKLKDQLTNCPNDTLRNALYKALGDRIDSINVADLMKEIEELAVVRQSNNVNTLAMITAKQEREEPVRQFAARLRGLAAVCDLSVTCTCDNKVSEVEKWVRLSLIGGLNDEDTKQEVLSKVEEMPLAETITFIEARETGKTATKILGGKMTSTIVNQVNEKFDEKNCSYCGKKGHGRKASF